MKRIYSLFIVFILVGCAKENMPINDGLLSVPKELYFPETNNSIAARTNVLLNLGAIDTTIYNYNVELGGNQPAENDIQINFEALSQEYVSQYAALNNADFFLLPAGSYKMQQKVVLKAGQTSTPHLPITLFKDSLDAKKDYVLPIRLSTTDNIYKVDSKRNITYLIIRTRVTAIGERIGNIPQLSDPRADLFDYYGDLMLKDTAGKLWVYPLENNGNRSIGTPKLVATGFSKYESLFFHGYYNKIFGIDITGRTSSHFSHVNGGGFPFSFDCTPYPNVTIGQPYQLMPTHPHLIQVGSWIYNEDWGMHGYNKDKVRRFFAGLDGFTHFLGWYDNSQSIHVKFDKLNSSGQLSMNNIRHQTSWQAAQRSLCTLFERTVVLSKDGLFTYASYTPYSVTTYPSYDFAIRIGSPAFSRYTKVFSIYQKDLLFYEPSGDIIRYRNIDFETFMNPTTVFE